MSAIILSAQKLGRDTLERRLLERKGLGHRAQEVLLMASFENRPST